MADHDSLERALTTVEEDAVGALKSLSELSKAVKAAKAAAHSGDVRGLQKALSGAQQLGDVFAERLRMLRESWTFDEKAYLADGSYVVELLAAIERENLRAEFRDNRVLCFPSVIRILPNDAAIEVDRKKDKRIRPRVVASELRRRQGKRSGIAPEQFMELLYAAYEPLVAKQQKAGTRVVRLGEIYDLLTLLPQAREYSKQEFARDLLQLDISGVNRTRKGMRMTLPASTTARSGAVFSTVTPEGQIKTYSAIEFAE